MNGTPEKKTSSYKSQPANETVIPIERETKSYKSKSKDPKPFENHESEINGSVDTSNSQILEETQRKLSAPKPAPEVTPIVQPEERIIEVNIEPEVLEEKRKESLKSSRKPSKTKIQLQEKELKIEIEPRTKDDEKLKEVTGKEVVIGHEKTQEENPSTKESHGLETAEVVQQKIENGDHTGELIHESKPEIGTEAVKAETIIATELLEATDTPIVTESPIAIDTAIVPESPIATETATATESPITTEPPITTQSSIATEKIIDVVTVDSKCENIEENLTHNIQNESIEKTEDEIPEQDLDKTAVGSDESILQIVDDKKEDNISTTEKEASSDIEQRITETTQESVIQTRQVIVSSTIQETTEIVVKSNELETGNTEQEYVGEQVMPGLDDKTPPEDTSAGIVQTVTVGNQEESENLINTKNINSEDLLNRINSEASADSNTPRERIIEIEIERPDDLEHIIEEVTDLRSHEVQRESDTEPLVEEPQSPETELIYNTNTTNAVCEVLSDVAEEA